jgi:hypothetical protein
MTVKYAKKGTGAVYEAVEENTRRCFTCKHAATDGGTRLTCHRYPPTMRRVPAGGGARRPEWPETWSNAVCGEWTPASRVPAEEATPEPAPAPREKQKLPMADLKEIRARMSATAPGPWHAINGFRQLGAAFSVMGSESKVPVYPCTIVNDVHFVAVLGAPTEDAERAFIVHSREDMEKLYWEVTAARGHLHAVLNACDDAEIDAARAYLNDPRKQS